MSSSRRTTFLPISLNLFLLFADAGPRKLIMYFREQAGFARLSHN